MKILENFQNIGIKGKLLFFWLKARILNHKALQDNLIKSLKNIPLDDDLVLTEVQYYFVYYFFEYLKLLILNYILKKSNIGFCENCIFYKSNCLLNLKALNCSKYLPVICIEEDLYQIKKILLIFKILYKKGIFFDLNKFKKFLIKIINEK